MSQSVKLFEQLVKIMKRLRRECPWDKEQTLESLRRFVLEEAYEVVDTIDRRDWQELSEELGDLLLQIVFQSEIAEENKFFTLSTVIEGINQKLIERHPHVFDSKKVNSAREVEQNWERIKLKNENRDSLLAGIPESAPALLRAQRIQEKASRVGFDWKQSNEVLDKIEEEIRELRQAILQDDNQNIEEEMGDLLFSVVNLSRFLNISAEDALRASNKKFMRRFMKLEKKFKNDYDKMKQAGIQELDRLWEIIKAKKTKNEHD